MRAGEGAREDAARGCGLWGVLPAGCGPLDLGLLPGSLLRACALAESEAGLYKDARGRVLALEIR